MFPPFLLDSPFLYPGKHGQIWCVCHQATGWVLGSQRTGCHWCPALHWPLQEFQPLVGKRKREKSMNNPIAPTWHYYTISGIKRSQTLFWPLSSTTRPGKHPLMAGSLPWHKGHQLYYPDDLISLVFTYSLALSMMIPTNHWTMSLIPLKNPSKVSCFFEEAFVLRIVYNSNISTSR